MPTASPAPPVPDADADADADAVDPPPTPFLTALLAGGMAGTCVDVALFPIDTVKTRLQAPGGFLASGGFRGMYRGIGAAAAGSAPGAALFFSVYEEAKVRIRDWQQQQQQQQRQGGGGGWWWRNDSPVVVHMAAAGMGEAAACLVRVPTEVVKASMQTNAEGSATVITTLRTVLAEGEGVLGGLYRGYGATLMREVPFALIQFPLYERLKGLIRDGQGGGERREATPVQAAACGSAGGAVAAALTTPLDVIKTRLMLGRDRAGVPYRDAADVARRIWTEEGGRIFWSGLQPRVMWISIGGFVFFGAYEGCRGALMAGAGGGGR